MTEPTRGERNNNPGNIDRNPGTHWLGSSAVQDDPRFVSFDSAEDGIRALAMVLLNYQRKHGLNTIRKIINRWAPPGENDTGAYVNHVAKVVGVQPDDVINLEDDGHLTSLVAAIIDHENGRVIYSDNTINAGVNKALA